MRTLFISALTMITSFSAFSQDTLFTRSGKIIPAKVFEINQTDIKYKKPSNPDGPLYTISKEEIAVIEYKNGSKDVFEGGNGQSTSKPADDVYSNGSSSTQVNNNYYGAPIARPGVNVVLGMGLPYWRGYYRPYYRPLYYGGGYYHGHHGYHGHHCRR